MHHTARQSLHKLGLELKIPCTRSNRGIYSMYLTATAGTSQFAHHGKKQPATSQKLAVRPGPYRLLGTAEQT